MITVQKRFRMIVKSLKYFRFDSMFYRIFFTIISIILLISILGYAAINCISKILTNNEINAQEVYLENNALYFDTEMEKIRDSIYSIENDNDLMLLSRMYELSDYEYYRMTSNIMKKLAMIKVTTKEMNNIYVYFNRTDRILDPGGLNYTEAYFSNRYRDDFNIWRNKLNETHHYNLEITESRINPDSTTTVSRLNIIKTIISNNYFTGAIVVNLDEAFINKLLVNKEFARQRNIYMVNGENQIISSNTEHETGKPFDIDLKQMGLTKKGYYFTDEGYLVTYKKSVNNDIYYIILTPKEVFLGNVIRLSQTANILIVVFMALGVVLSFFISQMFYFPISNVVDFLNVYSMMTKDRPKKLNEIEYIRKNLESITSDNANLENTVKESIQIVTGVILLKSIMGGQEINNAIAISSKYKIEFREGFYCVSVLKINKKDQSLLDSGNVNLYSILDGILATYIIQIIKIKEEEYAVVTYFVDEEARRFVLEGLHEFQGVLAAKLQDIRIRIGIGNVCRDVFELNQSYTQATKAIEFRTVQNEEVITEYIPGNYTYKEDAYIPCDMEQRLLNLITSGNAEQTRKYVNDILDLNYKKNVYYHSYFKVCMCMENLVNRMLGDWSLKDEAVRKSLPDLLVSIENEIETFSLKDKITKNITMLAEYYSGKKESSKSMEKVLEYVDNNFDKDINLESVAQEFDFNSNYLSRSFKQFRGISFTEYLSIKKVEKAKNLLLATRMSIKNIAEESGYNSSNIFIRSFEKIEGITPGEFRKRNMRGSSLPEVRM